MSIEADIASLKLIATINRSRHKDKLYSYTVHKLCSQVPHFKWVGLYVKEGDRFQLVASAGDKVSLPTSHHSIIQIPIYGEKRREIGRLTVTTGKTARYNETDYTSLAVLAKEISKRF